MKSKDTTKNKWFNPAIGAALAVVCGLFLWKVPLGEGWVNASYDYLFRFGSRSVTNQVVVILMDNDALDHFHQERGQPWDRGLHAQLLNRLADDGCSLVVFDAFFRGERNPETDAALAAAMRRQRHVALMAEQTLVEHPDLVGIRPVLPTDLFLNAAGTNWGIAWLDPDLDSIVRRHWPTPLPGPYPSLSWTMAQLMGAKLDTRPHTAWLRYYGPQGSWQSLSYRFALTQPTNYYRDKIVVIGNQPKSSLPDDEPDEFRTPYTSLTGESMGGVHIIVTEFLNLLNDESLQRPPSWVEAIVLIVSGTLLGVGLVRLKIRMGAIVGVAVMILTSVGAILLSHLTNIWFPWLVIAGGQAPCALAWALFTHGTLSWKTSTDMVLIDQMPETQDYELLNPPFGQGAYGKVWLARNATGQWQALKVVYLSNFNGDLDPYEREFNGIKKYKPVSDKHPALLRVDFVSQKKPEGYFFYVMELGDPLDAGWESKPATYKPRDLVSERRRSTGQRLAVRECIRIGIALSDALEFLHKEGLTHRDIKPQNIIFVNGQPKLADLGLIAEIRPPEEKRTYVGTPGYMPPPPELPGTPQADIYALGMLLYVLSTGRTPSYFPEISTTVADDTASVADFFVLNPVILKACQSEAKKRYATASEMSQALQNAQNVLDARGKTPEPEEAKG